MLQLQHQLLQPAFGFIDIQQERLQAGLPFLQAIVLTVLGHLLNHRLQAGAEGLNRSNRTLKLQGHPRALFFMGPVLPLNLLKGALQKSLSPQELRFRLLPKGMLLKITHRWGSKWWLLQAACQCSGN